MPKKMVSGKDITSKKRRGQHNQVVKMPIIDIQRRDLNANSHLFRKLTSIKRGRINTKPTAGRNQNHCPVQAEQK